MFKLGRKRRQRYLLAGLLFRLAIAAAVPAAAEEIPELDAVNVTGVAESEAYVRSYTASATKTDMPVLDVPMSVQAIPAEVLLDQRAATTLDAIRNVSGVQSPQGSFYDTFMIRGFDNGYTTFRNGLQLGALTDTVNLAFADRVEVIKGPASMLYGRVQPGGFVNIVTKPALRDFQATIDQQFGSWNSRITTVDVTGGLNASGSAAGRVIATIDRGDNYVDFDHHDKRAAYAALALHPGQDFALNLTLEAYDYKTAGRLGSYPIPVLGNRPDPTGIPVSRSPSDPAAWNSFPDTVKRFLVGFDWTWQLAPQWTLTQRLHKVSVDEVQSGLYYVGTGTDQWYFFNTPAKTDILGSNLDLQGNFELGAWKHQVLFGFDYNRAAGSSTGYDSAGYTGIPASNNAYAPGYTDITPQLQALVNASRSNALYQDLIVGGGAYLQEQASAGAWSVLLGVRRDRAYENFAATYGDAYYSGCFPNCAPAPLLTPPPDSAWSPRAAVLFRLDDQQSLYTSYSKSFGSNNSGLLAAPGTPSAPEIGIQYELGYKASLLDGKAQASATAFDLTKSNVLQTDPDNPLRQILIGQVRSRGLELDLAGQVSKHVSVLASYTLDPVTITQDLYGNTGHRKSGTPLHSASLWGKYDNAPGAAQGWSAALGLYLVGQRQGDDANSYQLPGYATVDGMLAWRTPMAGHGLAVQFNVSNLLDRRYFTQNGYLGGSSSFAYYGPPRSVDLSARIGI